MNKLIIFGTMLLLAVGVISVSGIGTPTASAVAEPETVSGSPVECYGNCGNPGCAAAQGGACDCTSCPALDCGGRCGGSCPNAACGAKVGRSCGCGR